MTKKRLVLTAGAVVGLLLGVAACASSPAGGDGGTVKVGAILSLSGVNSTLGAPEQKSIQMGVEALNAQGFQVDGKTYKLEFDFADDKSDFATTGVAALRQMVESDNLPIVSFGLGSGVYGPALLRNPVPAINILDSTYPSILTYSPDIFLMRGDSTTYTIGCVDWASTQLNAKSLSVINTSGEPYGEGLSQLVESQSKAAGLTVTVADAPLGTSDYGNAIATALASKPEVVYISSVTGIVLPILKQLRQAGFTGAVMHSSGVTPEQAQTILGANFNDMMANNYDCAGTTPTTSSNPAAAAFGKAYQARYNEYPQDLTMWAYDLPFVMAAAMTKAGSITDRAAITQALGSIDVPSATVSGWLPSDSGTMFTDRDARTLSEITQWCPTSQSIATVEVFDGLGAKIGSPKITADACTSEK
ncbi:ABC transporter substrate-binding protein [Subtercola frigoramans]|uniref:ABC-type branched-subunit amino acid transport system substrate-binding protein n=1 Tax=Subtercola frigoramans TaxID=120298 RepID=A0ABS2L979_9MICO|nr:ABC transporter substrate-binding protein [Subtercola frigoramans]MBM7473653.1 ABC-type branched-subunit amino acid transport system substrate-binding protein [Subtercola frigoramans]